MNNAQKRAAERAANRLLKSKGFDTNGASLKAKQRQGRATASRRKKNISRGC